MPIAGRVGALAVGDTVSVEGTFDVQKSRVVEVRRELHVLRPLKRGFGALGLVLLLMAVPRVFVWRAGRLALRG